MIPLFPLGTVLYPGLLLPLHIFEERYRRLVRDLAGLPPEQQRFGVVAIRQGREVGADGVEALHEVGCAAQVRRIEAYEDGRFELATTGGPRFRLVGVDGSLPYLQGDVEWLPEAPGEAADGARRAGRSQVPGVPLGTGRRAGGRRGAASSPTTRACCRTWSRPR